MCLPNTVREWTDNIFRVTNSRVDILESNEQSILLVLLFYHFKYIAIGY